MRILIAPRPVTSYSVGIFLWRMAREFERRGYATTSTIFHYTGLSLPPWDYGFLMGAPRHADKVLRSGKPAVATMGQPTVKAWCDRMGYPYLPVYLEHENLMYSVIDRSPRVVFISDYVKGVWEQVFRQRDRSFPREKATVIHHGIDCEAFRPRNGGQRDGTFVLGTVGAMRCRFRLATVFFTSRKLDFPHRLLIVGSLDDECREELAKAMNDRLLGPRTTYVPWVKSSELPQYYHQMDCLFHPVWADALAIVVLEALACGVPVVCPNYGGPAELIVPGGGVAVTGEPWNYDDSFCERMAEAVRKVRGDRTAFSLAARLAAQKNDIARTADAYLRFMNLAPNGVPANG
jgi:glycosyltransferase involved in cell wall biosynthesis